jgi:hypothetical protein
MSWFVDNANALYVLLGIIATGLVAFWWLNKRAKFLGFAVGVMALIGLVWLTTQFGTSDAKQLELNVHSMADAVKNGHVDELFKYVSKDFRFKDITRDALYAAARKSIESHQISDIRITQFEVEEVFRAKKTANVRFKVTAWVTGVETPHPFVTRGEFILEGDQWQLKSMRFYKAFVDTDQEIDLPGIR